MDEAVSAAWKAATDGNKTVLTEREMMHGLVVRFGMNEDRVVQE